LFVFMGIFLVSSLLVLMIPTTTQGRKAAVTKKNNSIKSDI
jgi:hypothetical protein